MADIVRFILLLLTLIKVQHAAAQTYPMLNYTAENGLPSNTIYSITLDSKGFLWLPTDKGISRFDGIHFKNYSTFDGLPDNVVFNIKEDYTGRLWFATFSGDFCYFKDDKFYSSANTPWLKTSFKSSIFRIFLQKDGSLNFILNNQDYFVNIHNNKLKTYKTTGRLGQLLYVKKKTPSVFELMYEDEIITLDTSGQVLNSRKYLKHASYFYSSLLSLSESEQEYLVERTKGIFTLDERLLYPFKKTLIDSDFSVPTKIKDGNFFVGLVNSVVINDSINIPMEQHVTYIENDAAGNYWFATKGKGLYSLSKNFKDIREYKMSYALQTVYAKIIDGTLYFTNHRGQLYRLKNGDLRCILKQSAGAINKNTYLTSANFLINRHLDFFEFYNSRFLFVNGIDKKTPDIKKEIGDTWGKENQEIIKEIFYNDEYLVTVHANSVFRIPYQDFLNRNTRAKKKLFQTGHRIFARAMDPDNNIWCSTSEGMFKISDTVVTSQHKLKKFPFRQFCFFGSYLVGITEKNKMLITANYDNPAISIDSVEGYNCIWESIYKIDQNHAIVSTNNFHRLLTLYPSTNGRPSFTVQTIESPFVPIQTEYIAADSANCYFFKSGTVTQIATPVLYSKVPVPIPIFSSITTKIKSHRVKPEITISYAESKNINIAFDNIVYIGKDINCQYSISEDETDNWTNIEATEINLNTPSYGTYIIKIRAQTLSSGNSAPAVLTLIVQRPFWATWWFIAFVVLFIVFATWFFVTKLIAYKVRKKQKEHEADMKFQQSEYKALNALMNPHFIFNSLNNIQGLINKNDKRVANEYLVIFSDLIRQNMHNISKGFITLQEELNLVENYLNLERLRFKEYLNYEIIMDEEIEADLIFIPPLMIQPLVENAVKHGLFPKQSQSNKLTVHIYEKENFLYIEIEDNGVGLTHAGKHKSNLHESFSLSNLQKRTEHLKKIQKQEIRFEIIELTDDKANVSGTRATITMELKE